MGKQTADTAESDWPARDLTNAEIDVWIDSTVETISRLFGKSFEVTPALRDEMAGKLRRFTAAARLLVQELESAPNEDTAKGIFASWFATLDGSAASTSTPSWSTFISDWAVKARRATLPARGWINDPPWHADHLHYRYRQFVRTVVAARGFKVVNDFVETANTSLFRQLQHLSPHLVRNRVIPPLLMRAPTDARQTERRLSAWQSISADWEQWTRLPYGLICLQQGTPKSWTATAQVNLSDRLDALVRLPELGPLALDRHESRLIRNALAHGGWSINPARVEVDFDDIRGSISMPCADIGTKAIAMAVANWTMMHTQLFVVEAAFDDEVASQTATT